MKRWIVLSGTLLLACLPMAASAQERCVDRQFVTAVGGGEVEGPLGPYDGNAVYFIANGREFALFEWSNLSSLRGRAMYKSLVLALTGKFRITAFDHHAPYCDDVDEIWVHND